MNWEVFADTATDSTKLLKLVYDGGGRPDGKISYMLPDPTPGKPLYIHVKAIRYGTTIESPPSAEISFTPRLLVFSGSQLSQKMFDDGMVRWVDVDADGDLDLVVTGFGLWSPNPDEIPRSPYVYLQKDGVLSGTAVAFPRIHANGAMEFGDYDNDGYPDMVLVGCCVDNGTGVSQDFAGIFRNDKGVFVKTSDSLLAGQSASAAWGDYDNDGDLDLLISANQGQRITKLYRNDSGRFVDSKISFPSGPAQVGQARFVDVDNDGDLDVVIVGMGDSLPYAGIFKNDGKGHFTLVTAIANPAASTSWADFDRDGDLDALIGNSFYRNDSGMLVKTDLAFSGQHSTWVDVNGDGKLDVVSGNKIYLANGIGFDSLTPPFTQSYPAESDWGDFDQDGDLDLALISFLYRNNGIHPKPASPKLAASAFGKSAAFEIPVPERLSQSVAAGSVTLSWEAPNAAAAYGSPLTYALAVGTAPGKADVVSPAADLLSGFRFLPAHGNVFMNRKWTLNGLKPGKYYWTVQAVDQNLRGSPFAAGSQFEIAEANESLFSGEPNGVKMQFQPYPGGIAFGFNMPTPGDAEVQVWDASGKTLLAPIRKRFTSGHQTWSLRLPGAKEGLCFVSLSAGNRRVTLKTLRF